MSWLPHPSSWGKKNRKSPSFIMTVPEGIVELLKSMGVDLKDEGPPPLYEIGEVTPTPYPRPLGVSYAMKIKYGEKTEDTLPR
jgi:hypothetical protein